jgi:hypothetical protein
MAQEIVKIAENNVEVRDYIIDKATDKKYYIKTESYGGDKLTSELATANIEVTNWSNKTWAEEYRIKMLATAEAKKTKLLAVKTAMEGVING